VNDPFDDDEPPTKEALEDLTGGDAALFALLWQR
jgi:hypothetical protein